MFLSVKGTVAREKNDFWAYELLIQALAEGRNLAFFLALKKDFFKYLSS